MNIDTIRYWHRLEHFYPYILEEQRDSKIKTYNVKDALDFPNYNDQTVPDNMVIRYYEIYLGIFKVDSALKVLAQRMHAEKEFRDESDETSCFCKIRVEPTGIFDKEQFRISAFPWAVHRVKEDAIDFEKWDEDFQNFQRTFFLRFFECHEILTYEILEEILFEIKNLINWNIEFEDCWMRVDRVLGEKRSELKNQDMDIAEDKTDNTINIRTDEEIAQENKRIDDLIKANDLLNSFYIRDLERVLEQVYNHNYGTALDSYVNHQIGDRVNVEENKDELLKIFNPQYLPLGKWPNGYGLRAMQQVSVNLALNDMCPNNVFSVNGPPGTGKTTLLRDIIAAKTVERAIKLLELETPDAAFEESIGDLIYNNYKTQIRPLRPELRNFGILVASNNNVAVKNISEELPLQKSIHEKYKGKFDYFSEVSSRLIGKETWGIVAAALGNYNNRIKFASSFWPVYDKDENTFKFNKYLREKQLYKEPSYFKANWMEAKRQFIEIYNQVQEVYADMQNCYDNILKKRELGTLVNEKRQEIERLNTRIGKMEEDLETLQGRIKYKERILSKKENTKEEMKRNTYFFWIKYLFKNMLKEYKQLEKEVQNLISEKNKLNIQSVELQEEIAKNKNIRKQYVQERNNLLEKKKELRRDIKEWSNTYNAVVPTEKYLSDLIKEDGKERVEAQNISPWNSEKVIDLREKLYLEAINLHRVFVENAPILYKQIDAFYKILTLRIPQEQAVKYATTLFQSFQMVVPVISTTFASVGTFLKYAGRNTFGLLLIDEAGQALPQSAVGAIWRSQKTIIVGDPLQIEPVVTIHDRTIQFLKMYFQQSDFIASKETSVQSLADACNKFGGWRYYNDEPMWIGSPLLVHGRCQKAIFDIANVIAYNRKMIYGTKEEQGTVCKWEHVVGSATNKHFVPEQAEKILGKIRDAFYEDLKEDEKIPSLFIITPFRSVKAGLIQYFNKDNYLYGEIYKEESQEKIKMVREWLFNNIGTIHTFQGKEADKVIIVLGVDSGNKGYGAIQWASEKPNILNVAVTRAKRQLYIVGDKNKWAGKSNFDIAYKICCENINDSGDRNG